MLSDHDALKKSGSRISLLPQAKKSELFTQTNRSYPFFVTVMGVGLLSTIASNAAVSRKSFIGMQIGMGVFFSK